MAAIGTSVELMRGVVSVFSSVKSTTPKRTTTLKDWLLSDKYRKSVERIRNTSDEDWRKSLKRRLPCITPNGTFSTRKTDGLLTLSGYVCIDIDGKDNPQQTDWEAVKRQLDGKLDILYYCGLSCGGNGLYCIIPIGDEVCPTDAVAGLEQVFSSIGLAIDGKCRDLPRLRCASYDPNPIFNEGAREYVPRFSDEVCSSPADEASRNRRIAGTGAERRHLSLHWDNGRTDGLVSALVDEVCRREVDITDDWGDWFKVGRAIAHRYGEDGRSMFHRLSRLSPKYNVSESERFYSMCMQNCDRTDIGSLLYVCRKFGVTING